MADSNRRKTELEEYLEEMGTPVLRPVDLDKAPADDADSTAYELYDKDGNNIGGGWFGKGQDPAGKTVYKQKDGTWSLDEPMDSSIKIGKDGKITVNAPSTALKNETFKKTLSDTLSVLSQNYKINKDYKYALMADSDETKTTEEWIKDIEKDLPQLVSQAVAIERTKEDEYNKSGVKLSDEGAIKMGAVAVEYNDANGQTVRVKDDTMQALPEKIKNLNVFKDLEGWDENSHMVSWGNLKKRWDRDANSDEDILEVFNAVDDYFARGDYSDPDEYAEMRALQQFIYNKDPNVSFWGAAAETVGQAFYGAITGAESFWAELFANLETVFNEVGRASERFGRESTGRGDLPSAYKDSKLWNREVLGSLKDWTDQNAQNLSRLNDAAAAAYSVTNSLTPVAISLVASAGLGNWAAEMASTAIGSKIAKSLLKKYDAAAENMAKLTATNIATGAVNAEDITKGIYAGTEFILKMQSAGQFAEIASAAIKTTATLRATTNVVSRLAAGVVPKAADVLAQVIVDVTMSNPTLFRRLIENGDDESKEYALSEMAANVAGEVIGVGVSRGLMKFGSSDLGLVVQAKTAPRVSQLKSWVGQRADDVKTILHGGDADWLKNKATRLSEKVAAMSEGDDFYKTAWNRAAKAERQLQNLTERRILRQANKKVGELAGMVKGDTWEETIEAAREVKGKMASTLADANNLINQMYRRDITATVAKMFMDNPDLAGARTSYMDSLTKVIKAEDAAGIGSKARRATKIDSVDVLGRTIKKDGNVFGIISGDTNEYILGQYRIERAKAVINKSTIATDVAGAKQELEYYTKVVETFRETQPQELVDAADELLGQAKKLSGITQDVRVSEGVMARETLENMRTSGFFDDGYVRTQRAKAWKSYREKGGSLRITDLRGEQELAWGFKNDAPEAFQDISLVLFDDINEVARQSIRKRTVEMLENIGFTVETKVGEESTRVAAELNKKAVSAASKAVDDSTKKAIKASDGAIFNDFFAKKKANLAVSKAASEEAAAALGETAAESKVLTKVRQADRAKAFRTANISVIDDIVLSDARSAFAISVVDDDSLLAFRKALDPKSREMLDNKMLSSLGDTTPIYKTGDKAKDKALELRADVLKSKVRRMNKNEVSQIYTLENFQNAVRDDYDFIDSLKRQYAERKFKNSLDDIILSAREEANLFRAQTIHKESVNKLNKIREAFDIPDFDINVQMDIENMIDEVVDANMKSAVFADTVGVLENATAGADQLAEYTTLQSLYKNRKALKDDFYHEARKQYAELIRRDIKTKYYGKGNVALYNKKMRGVDKMANQWADEVTRMLEDRVEQRFGEIANELMQQGSPLITEEAKRDIFSHIADINKEITEASKAPNIIKTYGAYGYEEFVEVSPTVANMFTTMPREIRRSGFGKTQQAFVRSFRFGTTGGLVPGSLVNQAFRDYGQTITMGAAFKGNSAVERELANLFGDQFAQYYKEQIPDVFESLMKTSAETGEDINKLIAKREMERGALNVESELERNIYQFGRKAKTSKVASGDYDLRWGERFTDKVDKWQGRAEVLNTTRETYLRKRVYNNALLDSMKQGLSVQESRKIAEFIQSEATTNFARQSYHLANLTNTVPYLGSAINGTKSFWRLASWDPVGVATRIAGGYIVPVIALTNMTLSNEEDRRIYKQIPEYEKAEHITFVLGGQILSIPIPQEISNFVTPVQHMIESIQGVSDHSFGNLMANDLLGAFPVELDGFMNIDADYLQGNIFEDNLLPGFSKVSSSLMPPLVKSGVMWATGVDPYTLRKINREYVNIDPETGEQTVMDYRTGEAAKIIGSLTGGFISAPMAQRVLENFIGKGGTLWADGLIELGQSVASSEKNFWKDGVANLGQKLAEQAIDRVTVERYGEESNIAWNREVSRLWDKKKALFADESYKKDMQALDGDTLSESARKEILSRVSTKQQEFIEEVLKSAKALNAKYDGTFDRYKFASVLSLMNMDMDSTNYQPRNSYASYISGQSYQINKAAAVETMAKFGFSGPNDGSIFGYYAEDDEGNITVKYNSPINILNYSLSTQQQNNIAFADIRKAVTDSNLYAAKEAIDNQISAIYDKKKLTNADYAQIEQIQINWNAKVAETIAPIISKMTPEAAINNKKVKDFLHTYIYVPSSYAKNDKGRFVSLGSNGVKSDAYYQSWIKRMFKINDKYKGQY